MKLQFTAEHYRDEQSLSLKTSADIEAVLKNRYDHLSLINEGAKEKAFELNTTELFKQLAFNKREGETSERLALDFHLILAIMIRSGCRKSRALSGLSTVALSGGVFQNILLLDLTKKLLEEDGFTVLIHSLIPANDGGISLGQAVVAMEKIQEVTKA
jgi:hydrogenase maturation protein HypF